MQSKDFFSEFLSGRRVVFRLVVVGDFAFDMQNNNNAWFIWLYAQGIDCFVCSSFCRVSDYLLVLFEG